MGRSSDKSILIVGAGPVGLVLAMELARRGLPSRIVSKAEGPSPLSESRALGINARTLTLLEASGISAAILGRARRLTRFRMRCNGKLLLTLDTTKFRNRYSAIYALPQGETERLLLSRLKSFGLAPEWQTTVEHVSAETEQPIVTLRHQDGRTEQVRPDILVGADGAHSIVRTDCGFAFPGDALENRFFLADYRYVRPVDTNFGEMSFLNPGVLGRLPVSADTIRYISTLENFEAHIVHPDEVLDRPWKSEFEVSFRSVETMHLDSVFLAGDAAHVHSPAGARGMNLGIEDACWLAWLLQEGREAEYSALRLPAVRLVLADTRRTTRLITLKNPILTGLRNLLLPLLNRIPAFSTAALRNVSGRDTPPPPWIPGAK